jgi:PIN domain nuclease of toxin-antitoxin system
MKILLDTHIWLWHLFGSEELPQHILTQIDSSENEIWISPISLWEALILAEKRKITLKRDPSKFIRESLEAYPCREAALNREVAIKSREVALPHQDPADRFIAATTLVYDLQLATVDDHLTKAAWLPTLDLGDARGTKKRK